MIVTPDQLKQEACQKELDAVLDRYGFKFDVFCVLRMQGMALGINLVQKDSAPSSIAEVIKNGQ